MVSFAPSVFGIATPALILGLAPAPPEVLEARVQGHQCLAQRTRDLEAFAKWGQTLLAEFDRALARDGLTAPGAPTRAQFAGLIQRCSDLLASNPAAKSLALELDTSQPSLDRLSRGIQALRASNGQFSAAKEHLKARKSLLLARLMVDRLGRLAPLRADGAWNRSMSQIPPSPATVETLVTQTPTLKTLAENALDRVHWTEARTLKTLEAYCTYGGLHPQGAHFSRAEEDAYVALRLREPKGRLASELAFLRAFSKGPLAEKVWADAMGHLDALVPEQAMSLLEDLPVVWDHRLDSDSLALEYARRRSSETLIRAFLETFPDSLLTSQAEAFLASSDLKRGQSWQVDLPDTAGLDGMAAAGSGENLWVMAFPYSLDKNRPRETFQLLRVDGDGHVRSRTLPFGELPFRKCISVRALRPLQDGGLLIAGTEADWHTYDGSRPFVVRILPDGSPGSSWLGEPIGNHRHVAHDVQITSEGFLVLLGDHSKMSTTRTSTLRLDGELRPKAQPSLVEAEGNWAFTTLHPSPWGFSVVAFQDMGINGTSGRLRRLKINLRGHAHASETFTLTDGIEPRAQVPLPGQSDLLISFTQPDAQKGRSKPNLRFMKLPAEGRPEVYPRAFTSSDVLPGSWSPWRYRREDTHYLWHWGLRTTHMALEPTSGVLHLLGSVMGHPGPTAPEQTLTFWMGLSSSSKPQSSLERESPCALAPINSGGLFLLTKGNQTLRLRRLPPPGKK